MWVGYCELRLQVKGRIRDATRRNQVHDSWSRQESSRIEGPVKGKKRDLTERSRMSEEAGGRARGRAQRSSREGGRKRVRPSIKVGERVLEM